MASGNAIATVPPQDFTPTVAGLPALRNVGLLTVLACPPDATSAAVAVRRLPDTASLATGATVKLLVSDDPDNPMPSGKVVLGVNFGKLGTTSTYVAVAEAALGTEATATVTLPSTSGQTLEVSIPIVVANMASAAASTWVEIRIRRLGTNASDTGTGFLLIHGVSVIDT